MKKNQAQGHRSSRIFRIFFISWMTCMLYIIPYPSMGQDKGITLNMKNAEATLIFLKIEQQSSYKFFYKTEQIKQLKNISIQVRNAPIKNASGRNFQRNKFHVWNHRGTDRCFRKENRKERIDYRHGKRERTRKEKQSSALLSWSKEPRPAWWQTSTGTSPSKRPRTTSYNSDS